MVIARLPRALRNAIYGNRGGDREWCACTGPVIRCLLRPMRGCVPIALTFVVALATCTTPLVRPVAAVPPPGAVVGATGLAQARWLNHRVIPGERIREIAEYYGVRAHQIVKWNKLDAKRPMIRVGQKLQQKQVLGYVGATGLATGPHVCFRVAQNGKYIDPARVRAPAGPPIPPEAQPSFASARDHLISRLVPTS